MRTILFVGDACVASGFAKSTHYLVDALDHRCAPAREPYNVVVIGINHYGDPIQARRYPYLIYPMILGTDTGGLSLIPPLIKIHRPDVIVIETDPWHVEQYVKAVRTVDAMVPIVGIIAIDGKNCQALALNGLALTVFWTTFAANEARQGGYLGPSVVIPLGVDRETFHPVDQAEARKQFSPKAHVKIRKDWREGFLVGVINRNQDRKRFDLTVEYFCDWIEQHKVEDAFLAIQACPTGDEHIDVKQLMRYRGHEDRLLFVEPPIGQGTPEEFVNYFYNCLDVVLSTSQGEGFGLTTIEAMATGRPCIVGDWSALAEWPGQAVKLVRCSEVSVNRFNVYGGVMDRKGAVAALQELYRSGPARASLGAKALALTSEDRFNWTTIGRQFAEALASVLYEPASEPAYRPSLDESVTVTEGATVFTGNLHEVTR